MGHGLWSQGVLGSGPGLYNLGQLNSTSLILKDVIPSGRAGPLQHPHLDRGDKPGPQIWGSTLCHLSLKLQIFKFHVNFPLKETLTEE